MYYLFNIIYNILYINVFLITYFTCMQIRVYFILTICIFYNITTYYLLCTYCTYYYCIFVLYFKKTKTMNNCTYYEYIVNCNIKTKN